MYKKSEIREIELYGYGNINTLGGHSLAELVDKRKARNGSNEM
jgi:hypothetical protein